MGPVPEDKRSCAAVAENLRRTEREFPHQHLLSVSFWDVMRQE